MSLKLSLRSIVNIKLQRVFHCLNDQISISSLSIMKNHFMNRVIDIRKFFLKNLSFNVKIFLLMNCWSFFNRQDFLSIKDYWIKFDWFYHERLLKFLYVSSFHTSDWLIQFVLNFLRNYEFQDKIMTIILNNVDNNQIMHQTLIKSLLTEQILQDVMIKN